MPFADSLPFVLSDLRLRGYRYWQGGSVNCLRTASYYVVGRCDSPQGFMGRSSVNTVMAVMAEIQFEVPVGADDLARGDSYEFGSPTAWFNVFELPPEHERPRKHRGPIKRMLREDLVKQGIWRIELQMSSADLAGFEDCIGQFIDWQPNGPRLPRPDEEVVRIVGSDQDVWWNVGFPMGQAERMGRVLGKKIESWSGGTEGVLSEFMTGKDALRASAFGIALKIYGEHFETEGEALRAQDDAMDRLMWNPLDDEGRQPGD